jgi:hypothetical protein
MTSLSERRALPGSVRILLGFERHLRGSGMKLVCGEESAWFREGFFRLRENSVGFKEGFPV